MVRTKRFADKQATREFDATNVEAVRARRSTANRLLTVLKAALNHAFQEGRVSAEEPWRKVKPFREVDSAVIRYLSADECWRLVNACSADFRALVRGALATGCRYGELTRLRYEDFHLEGEDGHGPTLKGGQVAPYRLTDEGRALFATLTMGRAGHDLIFVRDEVTLGTVTSATSH